MNISSAYSSHRPSGFRDAACWRRTSRLAELLTPDVNHGCRRALFFWLGNAFNDRAAPKKFDDFRRLAR